MYVWNPASFWLILKLLTKKPSSEQSSSHFASQITFPFLILFPPIIPLFLPFSQTAVVTWFYTSARSGCTRCTPAATLLSPQMSLSWKKQIVKIWRRIKTNVRIWADIFAGLLLPGDCDIAGGVRSGLLNNQPSLGRQRCHLVCHLHINTVMY